MDSSPEIIQQKIDSANSLSQFGVNPVAFHTHNGIDSPRLKPTVIAGKVKISNGFNAKAITDSRITTSSVITMTNADDPLGTVGALCFNGYVNITADSLDVPPTNFNYIIFL